MGSLIRQTALLTVTGLRSLGQRGTAVIITFISVACAVGVLVSLLAVREGTSIFQPQLARADEAIVLSAGASDNSQSSISPEAFATITAAPGVKRSADGSAYAYASSIISVDVLRRDGQRGGVTLAGYTTDWQRVEPDMKIVAGRLYQPGLRELIVSEPIRKMFRGFAIGKHITLRGTQWTVVGVFASSDTLADSLIQTDATTVMSAFGRTAFSQVTVRLASPSALKRFADSLIHNPDVSVEVKTPAQQYEQSFGGLRRFLTYVSYFIGGVIATGAIFGALNSLYASVDSRRREIAMLRAVGFGSASIVTAVLIESICLAVPAALAGALIAWLLFNGNFVNSGSLIFRLAVTPYLLALSIAWAVAIGLIGGSLPALRAARLPVAVALRAR
ncbi:MAG TPA: ABC transporter permease [Steroidobacteraceae bacterium]